MLLTRTKLRLWWAAKGGFRMNDAEQIEAAAADAMLTMGSVCNHAGVSQSGFSQAKANGRKMRALTKAKLMRAIKELSNEQ
jgi:hypothetical protein